VYAYIFPKESNSFGASAKLAGIFRLYDIDGGRQAVRPAILAVRPFSGREARFAANMIPSDAKERTAQAGQL
jgi:hypothetical protein